MKKKRKKNERKEKKAVVKELADWSGNRCSPSARRALFHVKL